MTTAIRDEVYGPTLTWRDRMAWALGFKTDNLLKLELHRKQQHLFYVSVTIHALRRTVDVYSQMEIPHGRTLATVHAELIDLSKWLDEHSLPCSLPSALLQDVDTMTPSSTSPPPADA